MSWGKEEMRKGWSFWDLLGPLCMYYTKEDGERERRIISTLVTDMAKERDMEIVKTLDLFLDFSW